MKLMQRFRKKPSNEEMQAQAARELEEVLSPAMEGMPDTLAPPVHPAAESEAPGADGPAGDGVSDGFGVGADVAPVTALTPRRRAAPKNTVPTRNSAASKTAGKTPARKVTPRKVASAPTVAKKTRSTAGAAKKPAGRTSAAQPAPRKRQG